MKSSFHTHEEQSNMHRWWSGLRSLVVLRPDPKFHHRQIRFPQGYHFGSDRILHSCSSILEKPRSISHSLISPSFMPFSRSLQFTHLPNDSTHLFPLSMQVRRITVKQREKKLKSRRPMTPVTSKVKKVKMKFYSSFKGRFRVMNDGQIRRWKQGKRHNAHSKSKKSKRRLRQPGIVPLAYAKVMKKLNFCG